MKMNELRITAKRLGINSFAKKKVQLIREIQAAEGNFPCFGTAGEYCDQEKCCFRGICLQDQEQTRAPKR